MRDGTALSSFQTNPSTSISDTVLPTGIRVAVYGLVTALITLGFTVGVQLSLFQQNYVRVPLAQQTSQLHTAIGQSMAALGTWVIRGEPQDYEAFRHIWPEKVLPSLGELTSTNFSGNLGRQVKALTRDLRELERLQHLLAELAWAPGRVPAMETYEREVAPIGRSMLEAINRTISVSASDTLPHQTSHRLLKLKAALLELDRAVAAYLRTANTTHRHQLDNVRQQALLLENDWTAGIVETETISGLREALSRVRVYDATIDALIKQRIGPEGDLFLVYYTRDLIPILTSVQAKTSSMAYQQTQLMIGSGQRLARWSTVVVLLALIMGILSAASLYTSLRTGHQVRRFAAKAQRLGQYSIDTRIGGGAVGEVYRAHHALLRRPTAIKLLRPSEAQDLGAQERFRAEVQLTSQLTHPNTIDIFDYGRTPDGIFFYAMELLEGVNLKTLVNSTGPLDPSRVVYISKQICGSLGEAHSKGLLHRDIKPSNIMLTERGGIYDTVKVVDFGLIRPIGQRSPSFNNAIEGTPMYLAPEVIADNRATSPRSDFYALGAVMYFLLTQSAIFDIEDLNELLKAHAQVPIIRPSERAHRPIPKDIEAIVMCCLAKDPLDRPESTAHLTTLLDECTLAPWTHNQAKAWWMDHGEALQGIQNIAGSIAPDVRDGLKAIRTATQS